MKKLTIVIVFLGLLFQDGVKTKIKIILNKIKIEIKRKIDLQPIIGSKICTGNVEITKPKLATINIHEFALC